VPSETPCRELALHIGSGDSNGDPTWTGRVCGPLVGFDKVVKCSNPIRMNKNRNKILIFDCAQFFGIGRIGVINDNGVIFNS